MGLRSSEVYGFKVWGFGGLSFGGLAFGAGLMNAENIFPKPLTGLPAKL